MSKKQDFLAQLQSWKGWAESNVQDIATEHREAWRYYQRLLPADIYQHTDKDGKPIPNVGEIPHEFVAPVMHTAVNTLTSQIRDYLTSQSAEAVKFTDNSFKQDAGLADIINQHVNQIYLRLNNGQLTTEMAVKDMLVQGNALGKTYIEPQIKHDSITIDQWEPLTKIMEVLGQEQWEIDAPEDFASEGKRGEHDGFEWRYKKVEQQVVPEQEQLAPLPEQTELQVKGTIPIIQNKKAARVEVVGFKDMLIDTSCGHDIEKTRFIAQKHVMTIAEAMAMGFKRSELKNATNVSELDESGLSKENLITQSQFSGQQDYGFDTADELEQTVVLYECYIRSSIPTGGKRSAMWQQWMTDTALLGPWVEVEFHPYVNGMMDITPDSFWSSSMFRICKPLQDAKSYLHRYADKNMMNAAFNRTLVEDKQFIPESLEQSQRPGAVIVQKRQGAVQPYPFVELPASYGTLLDQVNQTVQESVGSLTGAMTTEDGVQQNVTAAAVNAMIGQEALKSKIVAGNFVRTWLVPLFDKIYRMCRLEGMQFQLEDGTVITSDQWPEHYEWKTSINTPQDELAQQQQLMIVTNFVSQVPRNGVLTDQNVLNIAKRSLKSVGIDPLKEGYFSDPSQQQPSQDQIDMQAAQKEQVMLTIQEIAAKKSLTEAQTVKVEAETQEIILNGQTERELKIHDTTIKAHAAETARQKAQADAIDKAGKLALDEKAIDIEAEHKGHDIAIKRAQADTRTTPNGVKPL